MNEMKTKPATNIIIGDKLIRQGLVLPVVKVERLKLHGMDVVAVTHRNPDNQSQQATVHYTSDAQVDVCAS